jgi:hypothetical protein
MVEIKDSYFKAPDGNRYFRRNAPQVEIGSYGEKKEPITEANYLDVDGHIRYGLLDGKIRELPSVPIDWERENRADVEAYVEWYFVVDGTAAFKYQKAKEAHLKLVQFDIEKGALQRVLNNDANIARNAMKEEGNDARVCWSIWVVMSGTLAERFDTAVSLQVEGTVSEGLSVTAQGGDEWSGSETITLSPGTVFAYGLYKVQDWDGNMIGALEDDWSGVN